MAQPATRRQRVRAETEAAIKSLAWAAMREAGPSALSLRDVARRLGMAPSALYRYFPSRTDLLSALIFDAFDSLGEQVRTEYDAGRATGADPFELFLTVAHTYRRWALAHRAEWALIFSTSLPDHNGTPETLAAAQRSFAPLRELTAHAVESGLIDADRLDPTIDPGLRDGLRSWATLSGQDVPPSALAAAMWTYATMHGVISLELNGHLPPPMVADGAFFDFTLRTLLERINPA